MSGIRRAVTVLAACVLPPALTGCGRESSRGDKEDPRPDKSSKDGTDRDKTGEGGRTDGSWVYKVKDYGFSIRLPSADWKVHSKPRFVADFYSFWLGSPMLAGVRSVKEQTPEEFRNSVKALKKRIGDKAGRLRDPEWQEGTTRAGNPYVYCVLWNKGKEELELKYFYVAISAVYLKDLGLTVEVLFEGQGKMRSDLFKAKELARFEADAKAICLSVESSNR